MCKTRAGPSTKERQLSIESAGAPTDPALTASRSGAPEDAGQAGVELAIWRLAAALTGATTTTEAAAALAAHAAAAGGACFSDLVLADHATGMAVRATQGEPAEPQSRTGWAQRWSEFPLSEKVALCDAIRTGSPVLLHSGEETARRYPLMVPGTLADGLNATASIPLLSGDGPVLGAISFGWTSPQEFGELQVRRLKMIAELGSRTLARATAYPDRSDKRAIEDTGAHVLQEAFLPGVLPRTERLELAASYLPAKDAPMGGDWYDAFPVDGGMCLVVGDVSGHGLQPAAVMAQLRNAVRAFADEDPRPEVVATRLNRMLCRLEPEETATAIIAVWNEELGTITRTVAGHPPVLRCRANETQYLHPGAGDVLLGALPSWEYHSEPKFMRAGTTLLFYTDGLVEMRGRSLDVGMRLLLEFVEGLQDLSPAALCDQVLQWRLGTAGREDDICLLAVRVQ